jgi:hypothetical protein
MTATEVVERRANWFPAPGRGVAYRNGDPNQPMEIKGLGYAPIFWAIPIEDNQLNTVYRGFQPVDGFKQSASEICVVKYDQFLAEYMAGVVNWAKARGLKLHVNVMHRQFEQPVEQPPDKIAIDTESPAVIWAAVLR